MQNQPAYWNPIHSIKIFTLCFHIENAHAAHRYYEARIPYLKKVNRTRKLLKNQLNHHQYGFIFIENRKRRIRKKNSKFSQNEIFDISKLITHEYVLPPTNNFASFFASYFSRNTERHSVKFRNVFKDVSTTRLVYLRDVEKNRKCNKT